MVPLHDSGVCLVDGIETVPESESGKIKKLTGRDADQVSARKGTIAYSILKAHNTSGDMEHLKLRFDSMASYDITFVDIAQTAETSGMETFPIPYVLTNCYNALYAVGGTINENGHMFDLSAIRKYGGIYVPPRIAVIHQYMREMMAGYGRMMLGSDSHTRYGALGTMTINEGGGELVKQLLKDTYDAVYPGVVAVYLDGAPRPGTGPQNIALVIIGTVFKNGYVKSKVMEFVEPGVASMATGYRNSVGVMTAETICLSSIWKTDSNTRAYLAKHHREEDYKGLAPADVAYYDGCVYVDLSTVRPMIALPFHLSDTYEVDELRTDLDDILGMVEAEVARVSGGEVSFTLGDKIEGSRFMVQQAVIAGCAGGTHSNVMEATRVLKGESCGCDELSLAIYPSSQPVLAGLMKKGAVSDPVDTGAIIRTAFYGPCFSAGDTPCNNGLSIHRTTRSFPSREGPKPGNGQMAAVALMDVHSIAATTANGGRLTSAWELEGWDNVPEYESDDISYRNRVYMGYNKGDGRKGLIYRPNIKDWPEMSPLADNILLKVCSKVMDPVTTTDELIPSGEISSYRSNPLGLAEFTLSKRNPGYVERAKEVDKLGKARTKEDMVKEVELESVLEKLLDAIRGTGDNESATVQNTEMGSMIYVVKPDGGSAEKQAVDYQRAAGSLANICKEYVTKRYRFNVMSWGMAPSQMEEDPCFKVGDYIYVLGVRKTLDGDLKDIKAYVLGKEGGSIRTLDLYTADTTTEERGVVKAGCLINYNRGRH